MVWTNGSEWVGFIVKAKLTHSVGARADPEGGGGMVTGVQTPLEYHMAIGLLRNTGTDPPREAIGPLRSNCFSREVYFIPADF